MCAATATVTARSKTTTTTTTDAMATNSTNAGPALHCHARDADARLKIFLFPHAGGGQHSFNALAAQFGEVAQAVSGVSGLAELHTVLYPGPCVRCTAPPVAFSYSAWPTELVHPAA